MCGLSEAGSTETQERSELEPSHDEEVRINSQKIIENRGALIHRAAQNQARKLHCR